MNFLFRRPNLENTLSIWTIRYNPSDFPGKFTARRHWILPTSIATQEVFIGETLEEIRKMLPKGLYRIPRSPEDDPVIIESWI
jgi:hypothetical protein